MKVYRLKCYGVVLILGHLILLILGTDFARARSFAKIR